MCCPFFRRDVLDEIWDLIGSVSEGFPTYSNNANSICNIGLPTLIPFVNCLPTLIPFVIQALVLPTFILFLIKALTTLIPFVIQALPSFIPFVRQALTSLIAALTILVFFCFFFCHL